MIFLFGSCTPTSKDFGELLFYTVTSAGNTQTFVLESRYPAVAIILPGLTVGEKTVKYFYTLYFGVNCNIVSILVQSVD